MIKFLKNKYIDYAIFSSSIFNETTRAKKLAWIDLKMIRDKIKNLVSKLKRAKISAGVDEVGRGSLAGPVVAAAVIFKGILKGLY